MARLARASSSPEPSQSTRPSQGARDPVSAASSSPASSFSDKENRENAARSPQDKGTSVSKTAMESSLPTPNSNAESGERGSKRRRVEALRQRGDNPRQRGTSELEDIIDTKYYDPDQDPEERRRVRKQLRDLSRTLNESRQEYLNPDSKGLQETVQKANDLMINVKNTSDATIDSRLLVTAADLGHKKIAHLTLGSGGQGVEIDEFVSKCINFMRRGTQIEEGHSNTQNHRHARRRDARVEDDIAESDEEDEDSGDALNWAWLGRQACFPYNVRPAVPGFLLGPLSVQKRTRVQRRQVRLQRRNPADVVRPQELEATDLQKTENSNLTTLCKNIRDQLQRTQTEGEARVNAEATEDMSQEEIDKLMAKYAICDDGGVSFFKFVINPLSFGQTVENMFYVSFLIRDGSAGIGHDKNGLPTLHASIPMSKQTIREQNVQKHQAVFSLDWETWQGLIEAFEITECCIPNRVADQGSLRQGAGGWYG